MSENNLTNKQYSNRMEILRFLIVGIIATIFDLLTKLIVNTVIGDSLNSLNDGNFTKTFLGYLAGFIVGVIINYLLSTFWVFKNVKDDKKSKTFKGIMLFFLFSLLGFLIGLAITYGLGYLISLGGIDILDFKLFSGESSFFSAEFWQYFASCLTDGAFWLYIFVFCFQTIVVLVWNYVTRKKFIYIAPKDEKIDNDKKWILIINAIFNIK